MPESADTRVAIVIGRIDIEVMDDKRALRVNVLRGTLSGVTIVTNAKHSKTDNWNWRTVIGVLGGCLFGKISMQIPSPRFCAGAYYYYAPN